MASPLAISLAAPLRRFFSLFPLYTHPDIDSPDRARLAYALVTPWSLDADVLSSDVECLK